MKFDFDRIIDRTGTGSFKWDLVDGIFGGTGLLPLWVADMDFESPPEVVAALRPGRRDRAALLRACCLVAWRSPSGSCPAAAEWPMGQYPPPRHSK